MAGGAQGESRYCESLLHSFSLHLEMCESTVSKTNSPISPRTLDKEGFECLFGMHYEM
jgi:hypothetical protein